MVSEGPHEPASNLPAPACVPDPNAPTAGVQFGALDVRFVVNGYIILQSDADDIMLNRSIRYDERSLIIHLTTTKSHSKLNRLNIKS